MSKDMDLEPLIKNYISNILSGVDSIYKSGNNVKISIYTDFSVENEEKKEEYLDKLLGVFGMIGDEIGLHFDVTLGIKDGDFAYIFLTDDLNNLEKISNILKILDKTPEDAFARVKSDYSIKDDTSLNYFFYAKEAKYHGGFFFYEYTNDDNNNLDSIFKIPARILLPTILPRSSDKTSVFTSPQNKLTEFTYVDLFLLKYFYKENQSLNPIKVDNEIIAKAAKYVYNNVTKYIRQ